MYNVKKTLTLRRIDEVNKEKQTVSTLTFSDRDDDLYNRERDRDRDYESNTIFNQKEYIIYLNNI